MANSKQNTQLYKLLRALTCTGVVFGPYAYTMAQPEKTLKYRFLKSVNENGELHKVQSSYNRFATEIAYRMGLPEQLRRSPNFDIRLCVHKGLDFDANGHFTPLFDSIVYLMIPQWANLSSIDDLKNLKVYVGHQELDFSNLDISHFDVSKFNFAKKIDENMKNQPIEVIQTSNESKPWFKRWLGSSSTSVPEPIIAPSQVVESPPVPKPITREMLLLQKLIDTFVLSDSAKKYIIADQFEISNAGWHMAPWAFVAGSFFLPFTLYTRLRLYFTTRLKRFLFFHFLLLNGILCFYFSPFLGRLINMQVSRVRDSSSASYGLDIHEGGIEFLEKQLERNRILRELLANGKDIFDSDGERTTTRVTIPYTNGLKISLHQWNPILGYRIKRLKAKLDNLLSESDEEARKTIFKQRTSFQTEKHS